jgi:hypothetical protein
MRYAFELAESKTLRQREQTLCPVHSLESAVFSCSKRVELESQPVEMLDKSPWYTNGAHSALAINIWSVLPVFDFLGI